MYREHRLKTQPVHNISSGKGEERGNEQITGDFNFICKVLFLFKKSKRTRSDLKPSLKSWFSSHLVVGT